MIVAFVARQIDDEVAALLGQLFLLLVQAQVVIAQPFDVLPRGDQVFSQRVFQSRHLHATDTCDTQQENDASYLLELFDHICLLLADDVQFFFDLLTADFGQLQPMENS